jgi:hypothetical protein
VIRVIAAACAVGLIALTLTLGSLHHPTTAVSSLPQPPLSHTAVPPVVIAPPARRHPGRNTRPRVAARPHRVVAKTALRPTVTVHLVPISIAHRRANPHHAKRPNPPRLSPKPRRPPVTTPPTTPAPTPPPPTPPAGNPPAPTPPTNTVTTPAPPPVTETLQTRPGNGRGDRNHDHTGQQSQQDEAGQQDSKHGDENCCQSDGDGSDDQNRSG